MIEFIDLSAEQEVIGCILTRNDSMLDIVGTVAIDDFYKEDHRKAYAELVKAYNGGEKLSMVTLAKRTGIRGEVLDECMEIGYAKDVYAYSQKPATTLMHKAHPVIGLAGELADNKDFYGTEIRHPGDNPAKQLFDATFHTAKAYNQS